MATGWTWEYVMDTMTIPRYEIIKAEWRRNPPVHHLVAAAIGYKAPGEQSPRTSESDDHASGVAEIQGSFPDGMWRG
jgi:hypothetical protein